jgi:hypothetical protein
LIKEIPLRNHVFKILLDFFFELNFLVFDFLQNLCFMFPPIILIPVDFINSIIEVRVILFELNWRDFSYLVVAVLFYLLFDSLQFLMLVAFKFFELFMEPFLHFFSLAFLEILQLAGELLFGLLFDVVLDILHVKTNTLHYFLFLFALDILQLRIKQLLHFLHLSNKVIKGLIERRSDVFIAFLMFFLTFFC